MKQIKITIDGVASLGWEDMAKYTVKYLEELNSCGNLTFEYRNILEEEDKNNV